MDALVHQHTLLSGQKEADKAEFLEIRDGIAPENMDAVMQERETIRPEGKVIMEIEDGNAIHCPICGKTRIKTLDANSWKCDDSECDLILKKDSLFDRYIITDFEFEQRTDGSLTPYPVCPKCGTRRFT